jgi:hypothetical protein
VSAVNASASAAFYTGGLIGYAIITDISECYAIGAVSAQKGTSTGGGISAGGLVGFLGHPWLAERLEYYQYSSVSNCYALGNVFADNPYSSGGVVYAGALVGYARIDASKAIDHNFAAGSVTAQSNSANAVYAGGVVG